MLCSKYYDDNLLQNWYLDSVIKISMAVHLNLHLQIQGIIQANNSMRFLIVSILLP